MTSWNKNLKFISSHPRRPTRKQFQSIRRWVIDLIFRSLATDILDHRAAVTNKVLVICFRVIISGTQFFTNCPASMEWPAVTRCPCQFVLTCFGSIYVEKYARYVGFPFGLHGFSEPSLFSFVVCVHAIVVMIMVQVEKYFYTKVTVTCFKYLINLYIRKVTSS